MINYLCICIPSSTTLQQGCFFICWKWAGNGINTSKTHSTPSVQGVGTAFLRTFVNLSKGRMIYFNFLSSCCHKSATGPASHHLYVTGFKPTHTHTHSNSHTGLLMPTIKQRLGHQLHHNRFKLKIDNNTSYEKHPKAWTSLIRAKATDRTNPFRSKAEL